MFGRMSPATLLASRLSRGSFSRRLLSLQAPKRPQNSYFFFGQQARPALRQQLPALSPQEVMRELGVRWKALSNEEKQPYEALAAADKLRYANEKEAFEEKKGEDGYEAAQDSRQGKKKKKSKQESNAPKRPLQAYIFFGKEMRPVIRQENPDISSTDIMKELGIRWKALTEQERAPYESKAAADKVRYQNEVAALENV